MENSFVKPDFFTKEEAALILRNLYDRKEIWEKRSDRKTSYRNGEWFTIGGSMYLDLQDRNGFEEYKRKLSYWTVIFQQNFRPLMYLLQDRLVLAFNKEVRFLRADKQVEVSLPGFHLFPANETLSVFFGKKHKDLQWKQLPLLPNFPFKATEMEDHFSFTIPLRLPYLGGGLLWGEELENFVPYEARSLYVHSGQLTHAIAPYKNPVLEGDWRITIQGHGFRVENIIYIYW